MYTARIIFLVVGILAAATPSPLVAEQAGLPIKFALVEAGKVSLAVYDANGRMVRPMLYGQYHAPGEYTLSWDGLDRYGDPLPPGSYEWRLLRTPGFHREFLVNVGINTPWSPFDVWPGNHVGPNVLMVDDADVLYVGSVSSEGPPHLLKMSLDGRRKYWDSGTWGLQDGLAGLVRIGDVLYLQMGNVLEIRRAENGQKFWGVNKLRRFAEKNIPFADLLHSGDDRGQNSNSPMSLAGGKDFLVVTYRSHNEVRFLWPVDDRIDRDKTVSVPQPGAAAVSPEGQVFVISGSDVVEVNRDSGKITTIIRQVPEPGKIAYEPVFKDLLVVSGGNCVRRYHVQDGEPVAVYGRPEGRTYGLFNPLDFDDILDIAADRKGGFVTVEQYPRRVAHFRGRDSHELGNQWIGGMQWGSQATIDPADPTIAYLPIDPRHLGRAKIDFKEKTWTLTHLYETIDHGSWSVGKSMHRDILPFAGERNFWEVRHAGDKTFLVNRGASAAEGSVTVLRVDDNENRLLPVAHLGGLHPTLDSQKLPDWWVAALKRMWARNPRGGQNTGNKHFAFSWSDGNRNGLVDTEEIALASVGIRMGSYHCAVGPNWDVVCPVGANGALWSFIPNEGTLELPVWNWDHARPGNGRYPARELAVVHPAPTGIYRDLEGATYLTVNNSQTGRGDQFDVPPLTWPNNQNHSSRFLKWDTTGLPAFSVGVHTDSKAGEPGLFSDVRGILGEVKECLVVMDACSPAGVWTRDGLYAGAFNDDAGFTSKSDGWETLAFKKHVHDDNQWGQVIQTLEGDVLWGQMRDNSTPFYRITGWDSWERQQGELTLETVSAAARWKGTGLTGEYFAFPDFSGEPVLRRVDPEIGFGTMHGDHREVKASDYRVNARETRKLRPDAPISIRWNGSIEAPLSEEFTFRVYTYGNGKSGCRVRMWIDEKLAIDAWDDIRLENFQTEWIFTHAFASAPIPMTAGALVPIRIEYSSPGGPNEHIHLYWSSRSFDLRHVPKSCLYPGGVVAMAPGSTSDSDER